MYIEDKNKAHIKQEVAYEECQKGAVDDVSQQNIKRGYNDVVLNLFEKSPEIGRLLVRLHDRSKLYEMAKSPDDLARSALTQTVVDLLDFDLTPAEDELIADVLMNLITQAERDLRRALSERLAVMEGVPLRLVLKLANDEIFVADPVLRKSDELKDFDLIYILKANGAEHWRSLAKRPQISTKLVDMLVETEDFETVFNVVSNKSISLSEHSVHKTFEMSKASEALAKPLLMREELPATLVSKIYESVGVELKEFIKDNFDDVEDIIAVVDDVVDEFSDLTAGEYSPTQSNIIQAELLQAKETLTSGSMVENLRRGQVGSFVAQFSVYCSLPVNTVEEMIRQKAAHTFAIACKASLIPKADFINMFLLTARVRGARIVNESDLSRAVAYYDKISEEMARSLMGRHRH